MRLRALLHDRQAAVAPMVAAMAVLLVLAAGLTLDVELYRSGNRDLRAATEAAALAAAMNPAQAEARARDYLTHNGYDASVLQSVTIGRYCADNGISADQRFKTDPGPCPNTAATNSVYNAVRITTSKPSRRFLTGALGSVLAIPDLEATATAARIDEAGVEVTSGLITVSNSLVTSVNDLLGALLGVKLHLSATDIEALMGGNVDAGLFFDALARRANYSGTYGQLVSGTYGIGDIAGAAADAAGNPQTAAALRLFATQAGNSYQVPLTGIFGLGVWKNMPVGEADAKPALRAGLNAYQLMSYAVQAGPGTIDLSDAVSLAVPGSTVGIVAVATGPLDRPRFAFGPAGEVDVGTSALRLKLELGIGNINVLGIGAVQVGTIPVLIDIAAARAQVMAIDCSGTAEQTRDTRVTVAAQSGLVNAYIGDPPANAMTKPMPSITESQITSKRIVNVLNIVTVDARAVAQPVFGNSKTMVFGPGGTGGTIGSPAAPGLPDSVGNGSQLGSTISSLIASLSGTGGQNGLQVNVLGICLGCNLLKSSLLSAITTPLTGLVGTTADPLLDNVLAALGIELGHATVWVNGARCGVPVLV